MERNSKGAIGMPPVEDSRWIKLTKHDLFGYTDEELKELKEQKRRENIKKGMANSINKIGRPSKITDEMVKKAFDKWINGQISQKEVANSWGVSERTVRRKFSKLK